jgi:hypothetical protein
MNRSVVLTATFLLATAGFSGLAAAPAGVPFGCDAGAGKTCYFKIYYTPRATRIVQLLSGMKVNIPGLVVGRTQYCVNVGKPPANKCATKVVNANYNN